MDATKLCFTPATELSRLIAARELSPVELAEAVLARIDRLNPLLNRAGWEFSWPGLRVAI